MDELRAWRVTSAEINTYIQDVVQLAIAVYYDFHRIFACLHHTTSYLRRVLTYTYCTSTIAVYYVVCPSRHMQFYATHYYALSISHCMPGFCGVI